MRGRGGEGRGGGGGRWGREGRGRGEMGKGGEGRGGNSRKYLPVGNLNQLQCRRREGKRGRGGMEGKREEKERERKG